MGISALALQPQPSGAIERWSFKFEPARDLSVPGESSSAGRLGSTPVSAPLWGPSPAITLFRPQSGREQAFDRLSRVTMDLQLVILDTETATLHGSPQLLELGAVRAVGGEIVDRFEALVRPEVPIDPATTEIHGITESMIRDAEPAAIVMERFCAWVGEDALVAHNADFDGRVLAFECTRARIAPPPGWLIDTLRLSRRLIPESPDHKLATLCEHLELEEGVHHRALADAVWCWKILEACIDRMATPATTVAQLVEAAGSATTISDCRPRLRAAIKQRHRPLERACLEREEVILTYGDGARAPVRLSVLPRVLYDQGERSYLEAECLSSGMIKTYRLDRVHKVRLSS